VKVRVPTSEGFKAVELNYPSDEQWIERWRSRKVVTTQISRTVSEDSVIQDPEGDLKLIKDLCTNGATDSLTASEAVLILERLSEGDVEGIEREGSVFRVGLRVPGGSVSHWLRMPTAADLEEFQRDISFTKRIQEGRLEKREQTIKLNCVKKLYERLADRSEGYERAIPVVHMLPVVIAVMDEAKRAGAEEEEISF
jgi:hypothetical protein